MAGKGKTIIKNYLAGIFCSKMTRCVYFCLRLVDVCRQSFFCFYFYSFAFDDDDEVCILFFSLFQDGMMMMDDDNDKMNSESEFGIQERIVWRLLCLCCMCVVDTN